MYIILLTFGVLFYMKNLFVLFAIALLSFSTALSLEPAKVAFTHSGTGSVSVEIRLTDYTGGTANTLYTQSVASYTPNGSGVIIATVAGTGWTAITPAQVNAYCVLDVYVGGTLYAQYRLDQLILSQSSNSLLDNDGNLTPAESGGADLGNDNNRWGDLFLKGNTLHVGPDGGMAGNNELAISYNDADNSAHFIVAGTDALVATTGLVKAPQDFFAGDGVETHTSGTEKKMYFDYGNGSFRAGAVAGNQWDTRGDYSFASGINTIASGHYSTAMGNGSNVTGDYSTAMGRGGQVTGSSSIAMGYFNNASGNNSVAMGDHTTASGLISTAMGNVTTASGDNSTAIGRNTTASGDNSTAVGYSTEASGDYSTAMGTGTTASGDYSTAMGAGTTADENYSTAMGIYNNNTITGELLTVGNGDAITRSNALEVYANGDVVVPTLGNSSSTQNLQVDASGKLVASSSVVVTFSSTAPSSPSAGTLWYDSSAHALKIWDGSAWVAI
jgi:hypothetical protein